MLMCKHQLQETGNIWSNRSILVSESVESMQFLAVHQILVAVLKNENQIAIRMIGKDIAVRENSLCAIESFNNIFYAIQN